MATSSINRDLHNTNIGVSDFMEYLATKIAAPGPGGNILSVDSTDKVAGIGAGFVVLMGNSRTALAAQRLAKTPFIEARDLDRQTLRLFHKTYISYIEFGWIDESTLSMYGLANRKMPNLDSNGSLVSIGNHFIAGETERIAAGGVPIPGFNLALLTTNHGSFKTKNLAYGALKVVYKGTLLAMKTAMPAMKLLVLKIYNEVEAVYDLGDPASKRANSRTWGLLYKEIGEETAVTLQLRHGETNAPIAGVIKLMQTGEEFDIDATGNRVIMTRCKNAVYFTGSATDFIPEEVEAHIVEGTGLTVTITLEPE